MRWATITGRPAPGWRDRALACFALLAPPTLAGCDRLDREPPPSTERISAAPSADTPKSQDGQTPPAELSEELLRDRIILIGLPITDDVATNVVAKLLYLQDLDPRREITLYVNSPGGIAVAALSILETMSEVKPTVSTVVLNQASGAAAWIAAAGDPGHRVALRDAVYRLTPFEGGEGTSGAAVAGLEARFAARLARQTGQTPAAVEAAMGKRRQFDAEGALAWGLVDALVDRPPGSALSSK